MRQLEKKSSQWLISNSIPPISTHSPCHIESPPQQRTKALSQPQGHETPPQQGQGQQPESAQPDVRRKKSC